MSQHIPVIRPRVIFKLAETTFPDQNIEMCLTLPPSGIGSLLTLESALLVALLKISQPKAVFEIGTFNGNATLLFANNTSEDTVVHSLDLPAEEIEIKNAAELDLADADQNDQYLRQAYKLESTFYVQRASPAIRRKIRLLTENSLTFDPAARGLLDSQDFILIDGGHDYATIKNDSEKAFMMAKSDSIIVWHDYQSKIHTEVEVYLNELGREKELIAIGSTMLAICLNGKYASMLKVKPPDQ